LQTLRQTERSTRDITSSPAFRSIFAIFMSFVVFGVFLLFIGRDPIDIYSSIFSTNLASKVGMSEVGVRMIPFVFTGLATAIPARVGLINVGGEGQLYLGAWGATGVALYSGIGTIWLMIPAMMIGGFIGGAAWSGLAILLRNWRGVNEVISTLLLNFVAISFVNIFVFGPWKNPEGFGYPYTPNFSDAATLSGFGDTRFHGGAVIALVAVVVSYLILSRTRWGFNMRAIGGNPGASQRRGVPVVKYMIVAMLVGGGMAGLAGMSEVAGIQHHLRPGISDNFGFLGFLASWLANHNPLTIIAMAALLAVILVGGDALQFTGNLPSAAMFILIGLTLFMVLGFRRKSEPAT
jgi:simple sugar transport system permease protein